jgi:DNA repair protein RadC
VNWRAKIGGSEFKVMRLQDSAPMASSMCCDTPERVVEYLRSGVAGSVIFRPDVENLVVVLVNVRRMAIGFEVITNGTLDTILVSPREVFKPAVVLNAAAMILAHNHPSGDPTPSEADIRVTRDLVKAGQILQIEVLDHLILGSPAAGRSKDWCSLRELGYFYK